jgi:hypothetical protein
MLLVRNAPLHTNFLPQIEQSLFAEMHLIQVSKALRPLSTLLRNTAIPKHIIAMNITVSSNIQILVQLFWDKTVFARSFEEGSKI